MAATKEQAGTYRQIAHILRFRRANGKPDESARPRAGRRGNWGAFLDTEKPTLITFKAGDRVDIPQLIKQGAIEEYTPSKKQASGDGKGGSDGKASSKE